MTSAPSRTWRLGDLALEPADAHGGSGVSARRFAAGDDIAPSMHFLDYVELDPEGYIGVHEHRTNEEEYYLVLSGHGLMHLDGDEQQVMAGDVVRNRPGGTHGLANIGDTTLRLFVFEAAAGTDVAPR